MKKIFPLFFLLLITACSSSEISFTPRANVDPLQIATIFTATANMATQLSRLTPPQFPSQFTTEEELLRTPFPEEVTLPVSDTPIRLTFNYPSPDSDTEIAVSAVIITHPSLKLLEYQGTILRKNQYEASFNIQETKPEDGNLLTGNITLTETRKYLTNQGQGKIALKISGFKNNGFIPEILQIAINFDSGRESLVKIIFPALEENQKAQKMIIWNRFPEGIVISEEILWGETLQLFKSTTQGKNFLWVEEVTTEAEKWKWEINKGEIAQGELNSEEGYLNFSEYNFKICLNREEKCSINISSGPHLSVKSGDILAEGEWQLQPMSISIILNFNDKNNTFRGVIKGETDITGSMNFLYTRDLVLTDITPDEKGTGRIYSLLTFTLRWTKFWYNGESSYISTYHYPQGTIQEITEH